MKMEQTECSEMSAYKIQTPGNYPKECIQHSEHSESLKSRSIVVFDWKHIYLLLSFNSVTQWDVFYKKKFCLSPCLSRSGAQ